MKRKRCGTCEGCTRLDCGACIFCKDKTKFGGPGKKKKCCTYKKCKMLNRAPVLGKSHAPAQPTCSISVGLFLLHNSRKIHRIKPDGSCLFRTISYALLNTEDHDYYIRSHIVRVINFNPAVFAEYLLPVNKKTIREQVNHMIHPFAWGTHLEIIAAATLFGVPIFQLRKEETSGWTWSVTQPIMHNMKIPVIDDEKLNEKENINHIEMYYHDNHYDAIVSSETGKMCKTLPQLTGHDDPSVVLVE